MIESDVWAHPPDEPPENPASAEAREKFLADNGRCQDCGEWVPLDKVGRGGGHLVERRCPACGGNGVGGYVDRHMAMDACEPAMEGMEIPCGTCGGEGRDIDVCGPVVHPSLDTREEAPETPDPEPQGGDDGLPF